MSKAEQDNDATKPAWHHMPFAALDETAMVFAYGAAKHGAGDYKGPDAPSVSYCIGAAMRHLSAFMRGDVRDADSGRHALAHAAARVLIALERCCDENEEALRSL